MAHLLAMAVCVKTARLFVVVTLLPQPVAMRAVLMIKGLEYVTVILFKRFVRSKLASMLFAVSQVVNKIPTRI